MKRNAWVVCLLALLAPSTVSAQWQNWAQIDKEVSPSGMASDFGWSVAIEGGWALVGDWQHNFDAGRVYVYQRNAANTWDLTATLDPPAGTSGGSKFGNSVDLYVSGSTCRAIVGAYFDNVFKGSAFVYECGSWTSPTKLTASDGVQSDAFGSSVSVSGTWAVVGASGSDGGGVSNAGSAYFFERGTNGTWTQKQKVIASDPQGAASFGFAVSISGTRAAVSAINADNSVGAAYVFERPATTWTQTGKLQPTGGGVNDDFGWSISISGTAVLVGSPGNDSVVANSGSAYVFRKGTSGWAEEIRLKASDAENGDALGRGVHISGSWAAAGAQAEDAGGFAAGAIYLWERDNCGVWRERSKILAADASPSSYLGQSVQFGFRNTSSGVPSILRTYLTVLGGAPGNNFTGAAYWFEREIPGYTTICPPRE